MQRLYRPPVRFALEAPSSIIMPDSVLLESEKCYWQKTGEQAGLEGVDDLAQISAALAERFGKIIISGTAISQNKETDHSRLDEYQAWYKGALGYTGLSQLLQFDSMTKFFDQNITPEDEVGLLVDLWDPDPANLAAHFRIKNMPKIVAAEDIAPIEVNRWYEFETGNMHLVRPAVPTMQIVCAYYNAFDHDFPVEDAVTIRIIPNQSFFQGNLF